MKRKLSAEEITNIEADALAYMEGQVAIMVEHGNKRPDEALIRQQAEKVAKSLKRLAVWQPVEWSERRWQVQQPTRNRKECSMSTDTTTKLTALEAFEKAATALDDGKTDLAYAWMNLGDAITRSYEAETARLRG